MFALDISREIPLPSALGHLSDFDVAPDGSVALLDAYGPTAWAISPEGRERGFGREGSGPGELMRPQDIEINDTHVVVYDPANGVVIWTRDGEFVATEPQTGSLMIEMWSDSLFLWRTSSARGRDAGSAHYSVQPIGSVQDGIKWLGPLAVRTEIDSLTPCFGCDLVFSPKTHTVYHIDHGSARIFAHSLFSETAASFPETGRLQPFWMQEEWADYVADGWNGSNAASVTGRHMAPQDIPPAGDAPAPLNYEGQSEALDDLERLFVLVRTDPGANSAVDVWSDGSRIATLMLPLRARMLTVHGNSLFVVRYDDLGIPHLVVLELPADL